MSQPPNTDGIMLLTQAEIDAIKTKLQTIQSAFVPTDDTPVCSTFYLTATYNQQNPDAPINGDTCEYILRAGV
jgi:hypothetical protein